MNKLMNHKRSFYWSNLVYQPNLLSAFLCSVVDESACSKAALEERGIEQGVRKVRLINHACFVLLETHAST